MVADPAGLGFWRIDDLAAGLCALNARFRIVPRRATLRSLRLYYMMGTNTSSSCRFALLFWSSVSGPPLPDRHGDKPAPQHSIAQQKAAPKPRDGFAISLH